LAPPDFFDRAGELTEKSENSKIAGEMGELSRGCEITGKLRESCVGTVFCRTLGIGMLPFSSQAALGPLGHLHAILSNSAVPLMLPIRLGDVNNSGGKQPKFPMFETEQEYQANVDQFVADHKAFRFHGMKGFIRATFPPINHLKMARWFRNFVGWVINAFGFYFAVSHPGLRDEAIVVSTIVVSFFLSAMPNIVMLLGGILSCLGLLVGLLGVLLLEWFISLYNSSTSTPNNLVSMAIIIIWLCITCYIISIYAFAHTADVWGGFCMSAIAASYVITAMGFNLELVRGVDVDLLYIVLFALISMMIVWALAIFLLPEYAVEEARTHMMQCIELTKKSFHLCQNMCG
jgi:hypothetical protein